MLSNLPTINLVKNGQISLFDKFANWTLTVGRFIIIVTEIVAVIAFIYRFSLDEQLVNLHDTIKQQQSVISALKNDENKYRNLQDRIALASTFSTNGTKTNQIITDIKNLIPNQVAINNFALNKDRVSLDVDVTSVSSLENLVNALKNYHDIKSISIDNLESKPSAGLSVNVTAILK